MVLRYLWTGSSINGKHIVALPKFSRSQFAEFCLQLSSNVLTNTLLYQIGFGSPDVYQIFLRPRSSTLFKSKNTPAEAVPSWARAIQVDMPLKPSKLLELARAREAFQVVFRDPEEESKSLTFFRDGLLEHTFSREINPPIEKELQAYLDDRYRVEHKITPVPVNQSFKTSYFHLKPDPNKPANLHLRLRSRLESHGPTYYQRRRTGEILLTIDELLVIQDVVEQLVDVGFEECKFWIEGPKSDPPPNSIARSKRQPTLYFVRDSLNSLIELLEETRMFATSLGKPYRFIPPPDGIVHILGKGNPKRIVIDDRIFSELGEWCFDNRALLDLTRIWRSLYPGDLPLF